MKTEQEPGQEAAYSVKKPRITALQEKTKREPRTPWRPS